MLFLIWLVLSVLAASILLLPIALWLREVYKRYSGVRVVACPENQQEAAVNIDAFHAAWTGIDGNPDLRLCDCTRWPEHANCDRACLAKSVQSGAYTPREVRVRTKRIYHLPILLAASAAWYLGMIWHSQYVFRMRWMEAVGLTRAQTDALGLTFLPHLLSAAVCLLFAYGVAWLLAVCHRKGVLQGVLMAVLLSAALAAASWYDLARLPRQLLMLEAGYAVLATLVVGAVVGGLNNRLVLRSQ